MNWNLNIIILLLENFGNKLLKKKISFTFHFLFYNEDFRLRFKF